MSVNASTNFKGSFVQGTGAIVLLAITNLDGSPVDPYGITVTITGPEESPSSIVGTEDSIPQRIDKGFYGFEWLIDSDQPPGNYIVDWEYFIDGEEIHELQTVTVVASATKNINFYSQRKIAFRSALEKYLICAQRIPVYYEQSRPSRDKKTFQFTFDKWNQSTGLRVYRNKEVVNEGYNVDYFNGTITFDNTLLDQEIINADYNFKWFSDEELDTFLNTSIQNLNLFPPASAYALDNVPDRYISAVIYGAAKDALRQLLMCLQFQQPQIVFGGPDNAKSAFSNLESLKQNYEKDWDKLTEQKKYGPYAGLTKGIIVPEFTLPGGRSRWFRYLYSGQN